MSKDKTIIVNELATVALLPNLSAAVSIPKSKVSEAPIPLDRLTKGAVSPWGEDNLFPQNAIEAAYKSTIIPPVLEWKAKALYSGGLVYGTTKEDPKTGTQILTPVIDTQIDEWIRKTQTNKVLIKLCSDFYWFYNIFPEIILNKGRDFIENIGPGEAAYSRFGLQNPKNGNKIDRLYISANWENTSIPTGTIDIPILDTSYDAVNKLKARKDGFIYCYPGSYPTPGRSYYQVAAWDTLRQSGWQDLAKSIPLFKKSLMANQLSIKYHIETSEAWWVWKYKDFNTLSAAKRTELIQTELKNFNNILSGEANAGKSILSVFQSDPHTRKEYAGWRITPIDDKFKDGMYLEDSQEASSHHYSALGVDPTLLGNAPGKGMGAGSGSDKRVAKNIYVSGLKPDQDIILEPYQFIADYNGWSAKYPGLTFWFRNYWISTLDNGQQVQSGSPAKANV